MGWNDDPGHPSAEGMSIGDAAQAPEAPAPEPTPPGRRRRNPLRLIVAFIALDLIIAAAVVFFVVGGKGGETSASIDETSMVLEANLGSAIARLSAAADAGDGARWLRVRPGEAAALFVGRSGDRYRLEVDRDGQVTRTVLPDAGARGSRSLSEIDAAAPARAVAEAARLARQPAERLDRVMVHLPRAGAPTVEVFFDGGVPQADRRWMGDAHGANMARPAASVIVRTRSFTVTGADTEDTRRLASCVLDAGQDVGRLRACLEDFTP